MPLECLSLNRLPLIRCFTKRAQCVKLYGLPWAHFIRQVTLQNASIKPMKYLQTAAPRFAAQPFNQ
jgi:hypothetical protein